MRVVDNLKEFLVFPQYEQERKELTIITTIAKVTAVALMMLSAIGCVFSLTAAFSSAPVLGSIGTIGCLLGLVVLYDGFIICKNIDNLNEPPEDLIEFLNTLGVPFFSSAQVAKTLLKNTLVIQHIAQTPLTSILESEA